MGYITEAYIDAEDDSRYHYFNTAAGSLINFYNVIYGFKFDFSQADSTYTISGNTGDHYDTYTKNAVRLTTLVRQKLALYDSLLESLSSLAGTAQSLANQYKQSRHRTRQVYIPDPQPIQEVK